MKTLTEEQINDIEDSIGAMFDNEGIGTIKQESIIGIDGYFDHAQSATYFLYGEKFAVGKQGKIKNSPLSLEENIEALKGQIEKVVPDIQWEEGAWLLKDESDKDFDRVCCTEYGIRQPLVDSHIQVLSTNYKVMVQTMTGYANTYYRTADTMTWYDNPCVMLLFMYEDPVSENEHERRHKALLDEIAQEDMDTYWGKPKPIEMIDGNTGEQITTGYRYEAQQASRKPKGGIRSR